MTEEKNTEQNSGEDFALVFTTDQLYEAEMIKANLESAGIEAFILTQKDSSFPGSGDLSVIQLFVKREDEESALEYLEETDALSGDDDEEYDEEEDEEDDR